MRFSMLPSVKPVWLALALPFALLAWRLDALADGAGRDAGAALAELAAPLAQLAANDTSGQDERAAALEIFADTALPDAAPADGARPGKHGARRAKHAAHAPNLYISASRVLALADRRALPHAVPVPANGQRPAGLLLRGVSALGLGVQDGDVLTAAAGVPATSAAAVIGAVIAARGRHAPEIGGRIYRGSEAYAIVVEQPYQLTQPSQVPQPIRLTPSP
jgi:hypothetical protein